MLKNIYSALKKKKKKNKAFVPFYVALIVMFVFVPALGIVYDLANMRLYKTDITNIAQMAVLSCVAHEGNTFHMDSCRATIKNVIAINLFNTVVDTSDDNQKARKSIHPIPEPIFNDYFKRTNNVYSLQTTMDNVIINPISDNRGFYVVTFSSYKPTFIKFGDMGKNGIEIASAPVVVSASYICQHSRSQCSDLKKAYEQQSKAEAEVEAIERKRAEQRKQKESVWSFQKEK